MADSEIPQIYLISPPNLELSSFNEDLSAILDTTDIACFRLALATDDEDNVSRAADLLRQTCHARDVAIVIEQHFRLVGPLGLDGVHLTDGPRQVRDVRKELGFDTIVGTHCGVSRHSGLSAGEAGADYISFGPINASALGDGEVVDAELFQWWSEMIEIPVVVEGGLTAKSTTKFKAHVDFFALGAEIWNTDNPLEALGKLLASLK